MPKSDLRKSQWDQLFGLVKAAAFTPLTEIVRQGVSGDVLGYAGNDVPALVHKPTKFYFAIAELPETDRLWRGRPHGPFGIAFSPGQQTPHGITQYVTWDEIIRACGEWLIRVREDSGPDLWELAAKDRALLASAGGSGLENTPFTPAELTHVQETLDRIHQEIVKTQRLTGDQTKLLAGMMTEAKEAASRFNRKDWLQYFYGGLIAVAIQAAFAPEQARHLWQLAVQALSWIVRTTPLLP